MQKIVKILSFKVKIVTFGYSDRNFQFFMQKYVKILVFNAKTLLKEAPDQYEYLSNFYWIVIITI